MFLSEREWGSGLYVILAIFAVCITLGLIYLIFRSIKKEEKRFKDEQVNLIEGLIQKGELASDVSAYISRSAVAEFSLMYIDIDKFTNVYDAFGKDESDKIIQKIVYAIIDNLPPRIEMARLKDDKFILFAKGEYSPSDIEDLANKLLKVISTPINIFGDNDITLTASIGVSYYPLHGNSYNSLLKDAEIAVYLCKKQGGNSYCVYSLENTSESENLQYYKQIKNGIKNKEFTLYYQPVINCANKTIYGAEALLRWNHPEHGVLTPYNFINIMEQSGDINWVGLWGLEETFKMMEKLSMQFPNLDLRLSLNLSPKQLISPTLIADFQKIIKKTKIPTSKIVLEVEEFALFEKQSTLKQNIADLSKLGFLIGIDGFGLDYSTLSKLESMPVDVIKIDSDFLTDEDNAFILGKYADMLIDYSNKENKVLITERIENKEMIERALQMKVGIMQGYGLSEPLTATDFEEYVKNEAWLNVLGKPDNVIESEEKNVKEENTSSNEENTDE